MMTSNINIIIIFIAIVLGISTLAFVKMYIFSDNYSENTNVGGLQVKLLSVTKIGVTIPENFIEDVKYIIISNGKGDAESYNLQTKNTNMTIELKKIKFTDDDKLNVTMYNDRDNALCDYQEL